MTTNDSQNTNTNTNRRTNMNPFSKTQPDYLNDSRAAHVLDQPGKLTVLTNKRRAFLNALGYADKDGVLPIERQQAERKLLAVALIADACGARSWLDYTLVGGPSDAPSLPIAPTYETAMLKRRLTDGGNHDVNTLAAIFAEEETALDDAALSREDERRADDERDAMAIGGVGPDEAESEDPILAEATAKQRVKAPRKKKESNSRVARWGRAVEAMQTALGSLESAKGEFDSALEDLRSIREEFESWRDNLDGKFEGSTLVEKLETVCDLDLDSCEIDFSDIENLISEAENADLPLGFGRD